jgi:hypothetical protein
VTVRLERDKASAAALIENKSGDDLRGIVYSFCDGYCDDGDLGQSSNLLRSSGREHPADHPGRLQNLSEINELD